MGNSSSTRSKSKSIYRAGAGGIVSSGLSSSTSKLAARIAPSFSRQHTTVSYVPQKNPQTPTRTPPVARSRRHDRVIPAPETINQQQRRVHSSRRRVNLSDGPGGVVDGYEEEADCAVFDQAGAGFGTTTATNGFDKSRNWISTSDDGDGGYSGADNKRRTPPDGDIIDQWPCEIIDTDHPVIFVENRSYVAPQDTHIHQQRHPRAHSTPKQQRRVVFEKVDFEKYRRSRSGHEDSPSRSPGGLQLQDDEHWASRKCTRHFPGEVEGEDEYGGRKWCQDLLNWSREAAEYQRQRQNELGQREDAEEDNNWFHDKFRGSSGCYNKMSGTEDSGVVCQFEEDAAGDCWDDDEFWANNFSARDSEEAEEVKKTSWGEEAEQGARVPEVDSWEVLKQKVFERTEIPAMMTPSKVVRDSEGRILGRRCSCNSMCTSLCTVETWVEDEIFDNNFNEELERRVEADGYGICRN